MRIPDVKSFLEFAVTMNSCRNHKMDLTGYSSSVGTQTPTDDRSFEFPDFFSPSPPLSQSSVSSIGTQTRILCDVPDKASTQAQYRPKLFRRHSTGSDVYNFSSSPTLMTAFGGTPFGNKGNSGRRILPNHSSRDWKISTVSASPDESGDEEVEVKLTAIGVQLRRIADDFVERRQSPRGRSLSVDFWETFDEGLPVHPYDVGLRLR